MWVDESIEFSSFFPTLSTLFDSNGWDLVGEFTLTDGDKKGYVRLYEALGTDGATRRFGMAYAYDPSLNDYDLPIHLYFFTYEGVTPPSGANGTNWGNFTATIGTSGSSLFSAIYSAVEFTLPSPPTVVSLLNGDRLNRMWYPESEIYVWGSVDQDKVALFFRLDPTPDWTIPYYSPLYIGMLEPLDGDSTVGKHVLIGGGDSAKAVTPSSISVGGVQIASYGPNTANGNTHILLQKSKGGARCQKHYLAFITHDAGADSPEGRFNPSRYSGKYHLSYVYVVHPENGFVGKLKDCLAVHPKSIVQLDELEVEVDPGGTTPVTEMYRYTLPTSPSTPFRTSVTTPFNPIGLAIKKV